MEKAPFLVSTLINREVSAQTLVDSGCLSYGFIDARFARKHNLQRIPIQPRQIQSVDAITDSWITEVAVAEIDVGGHLTKRAYFHVAPRIEGYSIILGLPWLEKEKAVLDAERQTLRFKSSGLVIRNMKDVKALNCKEVGAAAFGLITRGRQRRGVEVFSASLADISKALKEKTYTDPRAKLPPWIPERLYDAFDRKQADKLPPHRPGVDHRIELEKDQNGRTPEAPWGPLYNMSRDELLVLRKTLTELLDKGFIRVSNSPAAAPVLFVRKPGGGLRFCCDYRALNRITRKDRYPLPLIQETLNRISKAKWYTKLDVIAAFNKIRIAEGDEWLTAFRTRFGLYEWLVTPFGLANAPSTFQRYINWALREFLDEFVSAYVDDVLIFTEGSRSQHREHVIQVLERLQGAGLQLDIDKCEFEVQSTRYLGFIIEAGKGIRMDPIKVKAIEEWEAPTSTKGVLGFLGFANFYRRFIDKYSQITAPLRALTKKSALFRWTPEANEAFKRLKKAFTTAPVLAQFDPDRRTILETDSSGYCTGGILSQYDDEGILRPVAYFSKKNTPAECNYEIYDKELLAIVKCLQQWDAELRSVKEFKIVTDHKNLEYFTTVRRLTERQMRWQLILSRFNFTIAYRPGKLGAQPDALTRRDQDLPVSQDDERLQHRVAQLLSPDKIQANCWRVLAAPAQSRRHAGIEPGEDGLEDGPEDGPEEEPEAGTVEDRLRQLWQEAKLADPDQERLVEAVREGRRTLPSNLDEPVKLSIADCSLNDQGELLFRGRRWVPNHEPLRTKLIQALHDSTLTAHPGRNGTVALVARQFFWPNFVSDVRRFVRNCDVCGRTKVWRDRKQGLLRPLPVPERQWREISIDFIGPLVRSRNCEMLMVITDRLGKGVILRGCEDVEADTIAKLFIDCFYRHHGVPAAIVSDRGGQFVSQLWKRVCQLLKIERRISTAYHPETDGATERANVEVETTLSRVVSYAQDDWVEWLPAVELALNGRESASTGVSPFFLSHGYHLEPLRLFEEPRCEPNPRSPIQKGEAIVAKVKEATEWAQLSIANAQQEQELQANRHRNPSPAYKVGDKVWLNLKNMRTDRPNRKLEDRSAKFTVTEVVGPHSYRLDVPTGVHNVYNVDLLRPAGTDPLPSQERDDYQPPPIRDNGEDWWIVEAILGEKMKRRRGQRRAQKLYQVKWKGYARPTWEPASAIRDTDAFNAYERAKERLDAP